MSTGNFPEGAALLRMLFRDTNGELGRVFDLQNIPPPQMEIERKYELTGTEDIEERMASLCDQIGPLAKKLGWRRRQTVFSGVDQYYVVTVPGFEAIFRHRFSANVPAELSVKIQIKRGKNTIRGEFPLILPDSNTQDVRAFMAVVCRLASPRKSKHFCVHQSGVFWTLSNPSGVRTEIVAYKVGRVSEPASRVFVEIEPKEFDNPEQALQIIGRFETALQLKKMRCDKSIAEMFG